MSRTLLFSLAAAMMLAMAAGGAVGSESIKSYKLQNAWPSKVSGKSQAKGIPPVFKGVTGGLETARRPRGLRQKR